MVFYHSKLEKLTSGKPWESTLSSPETICLNFSVQYPNYLKRAEVLCTQEFLL